MFDCLLLASASPRRKDFLKSMGLRFSCLTPKVSEKNQPDENEQPLQVAQYNARTKALCISNECPEAYVLGADTIVVLGEKVFNKPSNLKEAHGMLKMLSGKTHSVYTAVTLLSPKNGVDINFHEESKVCFKSLDSLQIDRYLYEVNPLDKAGGYAIQAALTQLIVHAYTGSLNNIIGLPTEALEACLKQHKLWDRFLL